ncbi:MAG: LysR family transcriptional regulator [Ruminococcaceae bacterium]|nr:LysR family transcriptional regulator [Oscillospiraceae bacterium]
MITLLQLNYFRKLAEKELLTKTAQELHISQTALSYTIINLEKELGVQLFDRSKRTIKLNDAGRIYLKYVNDIFVSLNNGQAAIQDINIANEKLVRLATGATSVWSSLFHDFCKIYPHHSLKQSNHTILQLEKALIDMTVDFVLAGENDLQISGMEKTLFKTDDIYLCVPQSHSLADRDSVCMDELHRENFISLNESAPWTAYCEWLFNRAGYTPHVVLECDYTLRAPLIASNFGVALTSGSAREADLLKPNKYIRIADSYAVRRMYLYHNPQRYITQAAQDFLEFCVRYYETDQDKMV